MREFILENPRIGRERTGSCIASVRQIPFAPVRDQCYSGAPPGLVTTGASRCSLLRENCDENLVQTATEGDRPLFAATHSPPRRRRPIPQAGKARAEPGRLGGKRSAGLAPEAHRPSRRSRSTLLNKERVVRSADWATHFHVIMNL